MTVYRTNQYTPPDVYKPTFLDRLSMKIVGHPNLFTNIASTLTFAILPIIIVIAFAVFVIVGIYKGVAK